MTQFYKHSIVIGLNDKDTLKQEIATDKACDLINGIVGDCTIKTNSIGYYTHANGQKVKEKSLTVEVFNTSKVFNMKIAKQIKQVLNQESIILTTEKSSSQFI